MQQKRAGRLSDVARLCLFARLLPLGVYSCGLITSSHYTAFLAWGQDLAPAKLEELKSRLREVEQKVGSEQSRLARLEQERDTIGKKLGKLDSAKVETESQQTKVQESVISLSTEAERLKFVLYGARQQMELQRARMHRRVVALYKTQQRSPNADYLFRSESTTDLLKRAKYLSKVTEHDQEYISELTNVVRRGQDDRKQLEELLSERRRKLAELTDLREQLERQKLETAELLREQEVKAEQQQFSLVALKLSANQLQTMVGELMDQQQGSEEVVGPDQTIGPRVPSMGLASVRGKLEFPVGGKLVQSFGKQRHTEFEDILFKKGLEIASEPGSLVRAVAAGKVLFRQELPGYGQVVIIDHGKRYYTLYGRLGEIMVDVGQELKGGDGVAVTGPLDGRGRNFYFELRHEGKAKDPTAYFQRVPSGA